MSSLLIFAIIGALAGCGKQVPPTSGDPGAVPAGDDKEMSQGTWVVAKVEFPDGMKSLPDEVIKGIEGSIKGNVMTLSVPEGRKFDRVHKEFVALILDPTKSPKWVDLIESNEAGDTELQNSKLGATARSAGSRERFLGIYKFEGDTLIVAAATRSGGERPKEFKPVSAVNPAGKTPAERSAIILVHAKKK